jgi:hypothetical protein
MSEKDYESIAIMKDEKKLGKKEAAEHFVQTFLIKHPKDESAKALLEKIKSGTL